MFEVLAVNPKNMRLPLFLLTLLYAGYSSAQESTVSIDKTAKEIVVDSSSMSQALQEPPKKLTRAERKKLKRQNKKKNIRHTMRDMSYEELKETKERYVKENDLETAIKYAEKMVPMCHDIDDLKNLTLELADLYYKLSDLEKAGRIYNEFIKLYPGNDKIEYAYYRAIICSGSGVLEADRDQTRTKETLELTKKFLERSDVFTTYAEEVRTIQKKCCERLAESELDIIDFYIKRSSFKAAQARLETVRNDFLASLPELESKLLVREHTMAENQNDVTLAAQKLAELTEKFPESQETIKLAKAESKKSFSARF